MPTAPAARQLRHLQHQCPNHRLLRCVRHRQPLCGHGRSSLEENVCVQPFVWCKSIATSGAVTNITNITWEQAEFGIPNGRIPLSAWTSQVADTNTFVYLMERTKDSGTRRCETQGAYYPFNDPLASISTTTPTISSTRPPFPPPPPTAPRPTGLSARRDTAMRT